MELPANPEPADAWREIRAELRGVLGDSTYEIWIAPLEVKALDAHQLLLTAPPATRGWVADRFGRVLESCARSVLGAAIRVVIESGGGNSKGTRSRRPAKQEPATPAPPATLNPRYSFDQFVIGEGNRLAHAACLAVAELPGRRITPSSSMPLQAWARPISCTRSATTSVRSATAPRSATRRLSRSPITLSGPWGHAHWTASNRPIATRTSC